MDRVKQKALSRKTRMFITLLLLAAWMIVILSIYIAYQYLPLLWWKLPVIIRWASLSIIVSYLSIGVIAMFSAIIGFNPLEWKENLKENSRNLRKYFLEAPVATSLGLPLSILVGIIISPIFWATDKLP